MIKKLVNIEGVPYALNENSYLEEVDSAVVRVLEAHKLLEEDSVCEHLFASGRCRNCGKRAVQ